MINFNKKKGQVAIFLVIALILIISFIIIIMNSNDTESIKKDISHLSDNDLSKVELYVEDTIISTVNEGIFIEDVRNINLLEEYIKHNLEEKLEFEQIFTELVVEYDGQVSSEIELNNNKDQYVVSVEFPIRISAKNNKNKVSLEKFSVKVPLILIKDLYLNENQETLVDNKIGALSGAANFKIQKNTKITNLNGEDVENISLEIDVNNNYPNYVVFDMQPDGTIFDPPADFEFDYSTMALKPGFNPEKLRFFLENKATGELEEVPDYTLNREKKTITAKVAHFSIVAIGLLLGDDNHSESSIPEPISDAYLSCISQYDEPEIMPSNSTFENCNGMEDFWEKQKCIINISENYNHTENGETNQTKIELYNRYVEGMNICYDTYLPVEEPLSGGKPFNDFIDCVSGGVKEGEGEELYQIKNIFLSTLNNEYDFDEVFTAQRNILGENADNPDNIEIALSCNEGWFMTGCAAANNGHNPIDSYMNGTNTCVGDQTGINTIHTRCCRIIPEERNIINLNPQTPFHIIFNRSINNGRNGMLKVENEGSANSAMNLIVNNPLATTGIHFSHLPYEVSSNKAAFAYAHGSKKFQFWTDYNNNWTPKMVIEQNGEVGIGTINPIAKLHVIGNAIFGNPEEISSVLKVVAKKRPWILWENNGKGEGYALGIEENGDFRLNYDKPMGKFKQSIFAATQEGNFGIGKVNPQARLDVKGDIKYTGSLQDVSDIRLKENIIPLKNSVDKLKGLNGFYFNLKDKDMSNKTEIGLSAQDVEKVFPEIVSTDENGYKNVAYLELTPVLIEAVKEQQVQIENLKEENEDLREALCENLDLDIC